MEEFSAETLSVGQIVFSKAGRDKRNFFVIVTVEDEYVYLSDGSIRKLANPKKKKRKHVRPVNYTDLELKRKLEAHTALDSDLRKITAVYNEKSGANSNNRKRG
ncbi:hypothetical protein FACS189490_02610 [Clostridia bacterium]|nr:hypothetical protein FACS189490_02610 [Clostridia bacterium]